MAESQQLALLRLYNGLARERRPTRIKVLERLRLGDTALDEPLTLGTFFSVAGYADALQTLADPADPARSAALAVSRLEVIVAIVATFLVDGTGALDDDDLMTSLVELQEFANLLDSLIDPRIPAAERADEGTKLLVAVIETARDLPHGLTWLHDGPEPDVTALDALFATIDGTITGSAIPVIAEIADQASVRCNASLLPVTVDEEGEYAIYLETTTTLDTATYEGFLASLNSPETLFTRLTTRLLDPTNWPDFHSFWCEMRNVAVLSDAELGFPRSDLDPCATGSHDRLIWEKVGFCKPPDSPYPDDLFPRTFLCFERSGPVAMDRAFQTYSLRPVADSVLAIDDGVIEVDARDQAKTYVQITKTLYIRDIDHRTEGHALAEFACQLGWSDQTRHLIEQAIKGN